VELLIALVLGTMLVGFVFTFVNGQARSAGMQSAREEVQQNARGALELAANDLRTVVPQGVLVADAQQLVVLAPSRWGILCSVTATAAVVLFPVDGSDAPAAGDGNGLMFLDDATWRPALPTEASVSTVAPEPQATLPVACASLGYQEAAGGSLAGFRFTGANYPAGLAAGSTVMTYQKVRYTVAAGTGGTWVYRSNGWTGQTATMQPLAGPVVADSVRFRYFTAASTSPLATPVTTPYARNLSAVRFQVRMDSRQKVNQTGQQKQDSVTVSLRNRIAP
jgi:hypothetical protein